MAERNSSPARNAAGSEARRSPVQQRRESTAQTQPSAGDAGYTGMVDRMKGRASEQINSQKNRATDGLGTMAHAVRQSTQQLREQKHDTVANYVEQAADQIERLSQRLKQKDVGELLSDAQRLARRQPALFVGSAFALGLVGARVMKSSPPDEEYGGYRTGGANRYPDTSSGRSDYQRAIPTTTPSPGASTAGSTASATGSSKAGQAYRSNTENR